MGEPEEPGWKTSAKAFIAGGGGGMALVLVGMSSQSPATLPPLPPDPPESARVNQRTTSTLTVRATLDIALLKGERDGLLKPSSVTRKQVYPVKLGGRGSDKLAKETRRTPQGPLA